MGVPWLSLVCLDSCVGDHIQRWQGRPQIWRNGMKAWPNCASINHFRVHVSLPPCQKNNCYPASDSVETSDHLVLPAAIVETIPLKTPGQTN